MADVLPNLQKLRVINFGDCLVRPGGAQAIASVIKDGHQQLEVIKFAYDEIYAVGCYAMSNIICRR